MAKDMNTFAAFIVILTILSAEYVRGVNINDKTGEVTAKMSDNQDDSDDDMDIEAIMIECNETFRTDMEYLDALNTSGSFPDETDRTPKCYVRCVLEKTEIMSEDGTFDVALTAIMFAGNRGGKPMDDIEEMATTCKDRHEKCKCEKAYQFIKCLMEKEINKYENS